jgi:altronate dehydratase small subunit
MPRAFQIQPQDNVATLLDDAVAGLVEVIGASRGEVAATENIPRGHKVALRDIAAGGAVVKFGVRIGHATQPIRRGDWVHLHNLASDLDERSGTLDLHSGAPTDTATAYV